MFVVIRLRKIGINFFMYRNRRTVVDVRILYLTPALYFYILYCKISGQGLLGNFQGDPGIPHLDHVQQVSRMYFDRAKSSSPLLMLLIRNTL